MKQYLVDGRENPAINVWVLQPSRQFAA